MTKSKKITFYIEGPDWTEEAEIDTETFFDERSQIFEAGTRAFEKQLAEKENVNFGVATIVKKGKKTATGALVNSYICLNNAGQYTMAENLRENFLKSSGQDLRIDEGGYSY